MTRKKNHQSNQNKKTKRTGNPIPWRYCVLTLLCGFFLITGFFLAARQHFSSIDLSIKNSKLRRQLDELESDKRRLVLAKEIALSPAEIKKVAKKIGFTEASDKIAAVPAALNSAVKQNVVKAKQEISNKIEDAKKAIAAPIKEVAAKIERPREAKEKPEKSPAQNSAR